MLFDKNETFFTLVKKEVVRSLLHTSSFYTTVHLLAIDEAIYVRVVCVETGGFLQSRQAAR